MKIIFLFLVFVHGLIHLAGFIRGWGLKEWKEWTLPVSSTMGLAWLATCIVFCIYGILYMTNVRFAWIVGLLAVVLSQILVVMYWKEAWFGTLPNIIILLVVLMAWGFDKFQQQIRQETCQLIQQNTESQDTIFAEKDMDSLPEPVKKWLRQSGAIGKPFIYLGKVTQKAEMKMSPGQKNWMTAFAVQYTITTMPSFIWSVDVKMNFALSFQGRDKYDNGKGEMLIRLNSLVPVVNERGEKMDEGTMQRYLGEMVWFPTLALSPYISWQEIDKHSAKATMVYKGTSASGIFHFNEHGDVLRYSAWRFKGNEQDSKRHEWVMEITDYQTFDSIRVPSEMTSTWKLEERDWTWLKLKITDIRYNERAKPAENICHQ